MQNFLRSIRDKLSANRIIAPKHEGLAVVVMDMQPKFLRLLENNVEEELVQSQIKALEYFSSTGVPIVVVEYLKHGKTIHSILSSARKSPRYKYFEKNHENVFAYINMTGMLWDMDIKKIFLMGVNASGCVYASALGASDRGFEVSTAEDVIADDRDITRERKDRGKGLYSESKFDYHSSYLDFIQSLQKN